MFEIRTFRFLSMALAFLLIAGCASRTGDVREPLADAESIGSEIYTASSIEPFAFRRINWGSGNYKYLADRHLLPVFHGNEREFYCSCDFSIDLKVIEGSCDVGGPSFANRVGQIEWEHVIPQSWVATAEGCESVAACKSNPNFKRAISDPFVLVPANGRLNAIRGNSDFADLSGKHNARSEGECSFKVAKYVNVSYVEPPDDVKGDLARITLYHLSKYSLEVDPAYVELMQAWSAMDPPDDRELRRLRAIRELVDWVESPLDYAP